MSITKEFDEKLQLCKDFNKKVIDGLSIGKIYHATTDKLGVCQNGLKPSCELDGKCGLGGETGIMVSFTEDPEIATNIAKDLKTMINIANEEINWDNYCQKLNDTDPEINACDVFNEVIGDKSVTIFANNSDEEYDTGDLLKQGYLLKKHILPSTKEEWMKETYFSKGKRIKFKDLIDEGYDVKFVDESDDKGKFYIAIYQIPKEYKKYHLWDLWETSYLHKRSQIGGRKNPVFWGVDIDKVSSLKDKDVGVFEAEGIIPKKFTIHSTWGKIEKEADNVEDLFDSAKNRWVLPKDTPKEHIKLFDTLDSRKLGYNWLGGLKEWQLSNNMFHKMKYRPDLSD